MTQNVADSRSEKRSKAICLVAEDALSNDEIAAACGVARRTIDRWKLEAEFQSGVAEIVERRKNAALRFSIAQQDRRIAEMDDRWKRMRRVITERAEEMDGEVAGGGTGLLVRQIKLSNTGIQVEEFAVDTGLLKEMRALEEQAAKELGQWIERKEHTGKDGGPIGVQVHTVIAVIPPGTQLPEGEIE